MPKLQPVSVLRSLAAWRVSVAAACMLLLACASGCSSDTGVGSGDEASGETGVVTGIQTTLEPSTGVTSGGPPLGCGDGVIEAPETCDDGAANSEHGACTRECQIARCGDGVVWKQDGGAELCDDGVNDGSYGGCLPGCVGLAPRCGDRELQPDMEECDVEEPGSGCLPDTCKYAGSCKQIRDAFSATSGLASGLYTIVPKGEPLQVYCDMKADGGGYTFLKVTMLGALGAKAVETRCQEYGMRLLIPRSPAHLEAAKEVARSTELAPLGQGGGTPGYDYLAIFGIYPVTPGLSCVSRPLKSETCPQWRASDGQRYWLTDSIQPDDPGTDNCEGCSMFYKWDSKGELISYEDMSAGGIGASAKQFMCDVGDKVP